MKGPNTSQALFARGLAFHRSGQRDQAEAFYRKAIFREQKNHEAIFALSALLFESGRFDEWTQHLERAVAICPNHPRYLNNLGEAYRRQGKLDAAKALYIRLLSEHPEFAEARQNLAVTLISAGAIAEAVLELEKVIALRPDHPIPYLSLAWSLLKLGRPQDAVATARRAIHIAPNLAPAHRHLADALDALGDKDLAIASYRRVMELDPSDSAVHSALVIAMLTSPRFDAKAHFMEVREWARSHADPLKLHTRPHQSDTQPERRLRLGYVSPDFRAHAVQQFLVPLLEHHDRSTFDIFLYSSVERPDAETGWYRKVAGERFRDISALDDVRAADLVRSDKVDILVDLALHSSGNRLRVFAHKPAPVQITWLGYAGTTGLDAIDFRITDPYVDPPLTDLGVYSERCLHLPETAWCYSSLVPELNVSALPARTDGTITFGSQNNTRKLHPKLLTLWARVLGAVSDSRLFLYAEEYARERVLHTLAQSGIDAGRIEFGDRVSRPEYLRRYQRIDIALDTFPFNGATTTLDALWMGVPVVTLTGGTAVHRAGTSIAMNLGLPELVATTEDEFVARAVALARDLERLSQLRSELRARLEASPLGDAARFARHLEAAFRTAWRRYCDGSLAAQS